jgi:hypothetical protein
MNYRYNILKKFIDDTQIKNSTSKFFYDNLIASLWNLYLLDKNSFLFDLKFINNNIKLFSYLESIIHIEMIISFVPYKCNGKFTILYNRFYSTYIHNKKFIDRNMWFDFNITTPWLKYVLYSDNITYITNLNKVNKNLIYVFSFYPTSKIWSEESEDWVWSFWIEFYLSDYNLNIESWYVSKKYIYEKLWRPYYSWNFYIWQNEILISSLEWKHLNLKKFIGFSLNNFILNIISSIKTNFIGLSNETHYCKHHKNFWWNYNNIFNKYGFLLNYSGFYETNNIIVKRINYDFNKISKIISF